MALSRRRFLQTASCTTALAAATTLAPRFSLALSGQPDFDYVLTAEEAPLTVLPNTQTPAMTFGGTYPAPVIRGRQGVPLRVKFINNLKQPTTIHWHGIRLDIKMDGVPFLSQLPVMPGESFIYDFISPDAGTFWYHPHVNSLEQLSKGMVGALIIDEAEPVEFDAEVLLHLKDWRLDEQGQFLPLSIPRYAARGGTPGNVRTVNGQFTPVIDIPAGGTVRARFLNLDPTRVYHIALKDQPAQVMAIDGSPVRQTYPLEVHNMGAGMRLDLGLMAPTEVGKEVVVYDKKGRGYFELFRFRAVASDLPPRQSLPKLPMNPVPEPDLDNAEVLKFVFEWEGALSPTKKDGKVDHAFWTINRRAWEGMSANNIPAPLATLKLGKTYIIDLHNATPHHHPIHMHGLIFTVISSNKYAIDQPWHTDTILMQKNERARIAFVADNPGRWMFHCHVIEHMKTGLMGYITIE